MPPFNIDTETLARVNQARGANGLPPMTVQQAVKAISQAGPVDWTTFDPVAYLANWRG